MLVTAEEAGVKWCPHHRTAWANYVGDGEKWQTSNGPTFNHVKISHSTQESYGIAACISSNCMMWRWGDKEGTENRRGFCGLAGK